MPEIAKHWRIRPLRRVGGLTCARRMLRELRTLYTKKSPDCLQAEPGEYLLKRKGFSFG